MPPSSKGERGSEKNEKNTGSFEGAPTTLAATGPVLPSSSPPPSSSSSSSSSTATAATTTTTATTATTTTATATATTTAPSAPTVEPSSTTTTTAAAPTGAAAEYGHDGHDGHDGREDADLKPTASGGAHFDMFADEVPPALLFGGVPKNNNAEEPRMEEDFDEGGD